jgi:flagellar biosynthetic protein FliP
MSAVLVAAMASVPDLGFAATRAAAAIARTAPAGVAAGTPFGAEGADGALRIGLVVALIALVPAVLIATTCFVRIIVVLSMIRHAFGMPETPPTQVLVSLGLFLTAFTMAPTFDAVNQQALQPFLDAKLTTREAIDAASGPMRTFMLRQVRDEDIKTVYDMAHKPLPARAQDVSLVQLIPAFMLGELRVAFRIGFVVLLPFLLIDLVVSSILLALGMLMVPPTTLSLPIKILMFVLIDGWSLVLLGVVGSVH